MIILFVHSRENNFHFIGKMSVHKSGRRDYLIHLIFMEDFEDMWAIRLYQQTTVFMAAADLRILFYLNEKKN